MSESQPQETPWGLVTGGFKFVYNLNFHSAPKTGDYSLKACCRDGKKCPLPSVFFSTSPSPQQSTLFLQHVKGSERQPLSETLGPPRESNTPKTEAWGWNPLGKSKERFGWGNRSLSMRPRHLSGTLVHSPTRRWEDPMHPGQEIPALSRVSV